MSRDVSGVSRERGQALNIELTQAAAEPQSNF